MFFKNVMSYSAVNFYAQIVRLLQELGVRFLLPPEVLGLWSLILVIQNFSLSFDWGILTAASRELPLLYGGDHYQAAADYRQTTFYLHVIGKLLISIGVIIYGAYYYLFPFQIQFVAIIAAAMMLSMSGIGEAFISFYQSAQQYVALSKKLFIYWTFYALLLVIGAYYWAVKGLIIATLLALALQAYLLHQSLDYIAIGRFTKSYIKSIVSFALPFRLVDFPISIATSLDTVIVARWFDLKVLAIYATAKLIFNQAGQVPTWIGSVFISRMTTMAGAKQTRENIGKEMLMNLTVLNLLLLPLLIGFISLVTYWGVSLYLPKYADALMVLPILLISLYFQPRVTVIRNYWIIDKQFGWLAMSNLVVIGLMAIGYAALLWLHHTSLIAVALVYTLAFAGYFFFVLLRLGIELWGMKRWSLFMLETLSALTMLLCAFYMAGLFSLVDSHTITFRQIGQSILSFFAVLLPLFLYGAWRLDVGQHLLVYLRDKRSVTE